MSEKQIEDHIAGLLELNEENEENLIELNLDLDSSSEGNMLNQSFNESSLIGEAIDITIQDNDQHLLVASIAGINPSTGTQSSGAVKDISDIISNINIDLESFDMSLDENESNEVKVPLRYTESEIKYFSQLFKGMNSFKGLRSYSKIIKEKLDKISQVNGELDNLSFKARELKKEIDEKTPTISVAKARKVAMDKIRQGKPVTTTERNLIEGLSENQIDKDYSVASYEEHNLSRRNSKITEMYTQLKEKETRYYNELKKEKEKLRDSVVSSGDTDITEILNNISKITQVELGYGMAVNSNWKFPIAVRCECNEVTFSDINHIPYYLGGDIYKNFEERTNLNREVKENYFSNKSVLRLEGTRRVMEAESNASEARIVIPGYNSDENNEPLTCKSCNKYLIFAPEIIERLTEHGVMVDTLINELVGIDKIKYEDTESGIKFYLFEKLIPSKYIADLGLTELIKSNETKTISSDIQTVDRISAANSKVNEDVLKYYANIAGIAENENIEEVIRNHIEGTKAVIRQLLNKYKSPKITRDMQPSKIAKLKERKERNSKITKFLLSSEGLITKYALDKNISRLGIEREIVESEDNINVMKRKIESHLINDLVRSIVKDEPIIVIELGRLKAIKRGGRGLPHVCFFKAYHKVIKEYLFSAEVNRRNKVGALVSSKEDKKYMELYDTFRKMNSLQSIKDIKIATLESEKIVRTLSDGMDDYYREPNVDDFDLTDEKQKQKYEYLVSKSEKYNEERKKAFNEYVTNPKLVAETVYSDGKVQGWIYRESMRYNLMHLNLSLHYVDIYDDVYSYN